MYYCVMSSTVRYSYSSTYRSTRGRRIRSDRTDPPHGGGEEQAHSAADHRDAPATASRLQVSWACRQHAGPMHHQLQVCTVCQARYPSRQQQPLYIAIATEW